MQYKSNNNVVYSCKYHVVWCPKYRKPVLVGDVAARLRALVMERASEIGADVLELEIMPDHVHMLVEIDPQFGINRAVRSIKGYSSRILRSEFRHLTTRIPALWTTSYFVSTVGGAPLAAVKRYIENQEPAYKRKTARKAGARP
jgi:putative transposase